MRVGAPSATEMALATRAAALVTTGEEQTFDSALRRVLTDDVSLYLQLKQECLQDHPPNRRKKRRGR